MTWAVERACRSAGQKLVLLMLANHANGHTGQCNPSHRLLAEECCMGVSTLKGHLQALADDGFIEIIRRQHEGVDLPNQYRLMLNPPGQILAPPQPESDPTPRPESGYKPGNSSNQEENQNLPPTPQGGKAPRKRRAEADVSGFVAPDWLDQNAWAGFEEMRRKIKKPMTDRARDLAIAELVKLEAQGHKHADVLNQSTLNSWQGLFPIKAAAARQPGGMPPSVHSGFDQIDYGKGIRRL